MIFLKRVSKCLFTNIQKSSRKNALYLSLSCTSSTSLHNGKSHFSTSKNNDIIEIKKNLKVCIVGSGPSGFYTAKYLMKHLPANAEIDMIEKLPMPYGLVRTGVAPDHPEVKSVTNDFEDVASDNRFQFYGNIKLGDDFQIEELQSWYDIIILTYGAGSDRKMNIPGEDLMGVIGARSFVNWYNGDPDVWNSALHNPSSMAKQIENSIGIGLDLNNNNNKNTDTNNNINTDRKTAVIIGQGNVALDCARILAKGEKGLSTTDICGKALEKLSQSNIKDILIVGRRGSVQAAFTIKELRELTKLNTEDLHVKCNVNPMELKLSMTESSLEEISKSRPKKRINDLLQKIASTSTSTSTSTSNIDTKNINLKFLYSPIEIKPDPKDINRVGSIILNRNMLQGPPNLQKAIKKTQNSENENTENENNIIEIKCSLVIRSIGYQSLQIQGIPFHHEKAIVPHHHGRVLQYMENHSHDDYSDNNNNIMNDNTTNKQQPSIVIPGLYCAGWLKRGPSGIIGTNIICAKETVESILHDLNNNNKEENENEKGGRKALVSYFNNINFINNNHNHYTEQPSPSKKQLVNWTGWKKLNQYEINQGMKKGKPREKLLDIQQMLDICK